MGCGGGDRKAPEFRNASMEPAILSPGTSGLVTLEVADRFKVVWKVEGRLREDDRIVFEFNDTGENGDVVAGDDFWSIKVDVPFQSPPGEYHLEIVGYGASGDPVFVRNTEGDSVPLSALVDVVVRYPEGASDSDDE